MAISITYGVGKGDLGMVTTFYSHNQTKMEALEALGIIHQHDSPKPRVFVVRRYTNTPFIPQGTSRLLYLNVSDLSQGTSSTQFSLDCLHPQKLLPYSKTEVLLPCEEGADGVQNIPPFSRGSMEMLQRVAPPLQHIVTINAFTSSSSPPRRRHSDVGIIGL